MNVPPIRAKLATTSLVLALLFLAACTPLPAAPTATPAQLSTATVTQTVHAEQTFTNTQPLDLPGGAVANGDLVPCAAVKEGEVSQVVPGTFLIGDLEVNEIRYYNSREDNEATVAYFERDASVFVPGGAHCYQGSIYFLNSMISDQFRTGCVSGCRKVRMVVFRADGGEETQCYYIDGSTGALQSDGEERRCPDR
jgi:hypothetical protein